MNTIPAKRATSNPVAAHDWMQHRACNTDNPDQDLWFPEAKSFQKRSLVNRAAIQACNGCPVRQQCLDLAIENRERHGIWGGRDFDAQPVCDHCDRVLALYTTGATAQTIVDATGHPATRLAQHLSHHGHYHVAKDLGWYPTRKKDAA